jgi:amino acid transporter
MLSKVLSRTHNKHHTPYVGVNIMVAVSMLIFAGCFKLKAIDVGRFGATADILALFLSYILVTVCANVFFHRDKSPNGRQVCASDFVSLDFSHPVFLRHLSFT